jgi:hypothetical protein
MWRNLPMLWKPYNTGKPGCPGTNLNNNCPIFSYKKRPGRFFRQPGRILRKNRVVLFCRCFVIDVVFGNRRQQFISFLFFIQGGLQHTCYILVSKCTGKLRKTAIR